MANLLGIGLSGLSVSQTALAITGHNISNVKTPGFTRQEAVQATTPAQFSGGGYIGTGSTLVDVRRIYNEFLTTQVRSSTALNKDAESYLSQINQLDSLLASSTTGITPGLQRLFSALQTAAEDPANIPARQLVLSEAEGVAKRFNNVYDRLAEQNAFINQQLSGVSDQVNQLATAIAGYNDAIAIAASNGLQPNDLLDAREESVRKLSEYIGVTVVAQDDNTVNLFIGSGQPLVVGNAASRLEVVAGSSDPLRSEVQFITGNSRQGITSLITGGEMGGLIRYREDVLDVTLNSVGRLALSVSDQINSQLGQGLDLKGNFGAELFRDINDPISTAQRSLARIGNSDPTANLNVVIEDSTQLSTSDYEVTFTSATDYTVRRISDSTTFGPIDITVQPPPAGSQVDGFSLNSAAGTYVAGDRFLVTPTRNGGRDIREDMQKADELAFASPFKATTSPANIGSGVVSQPSVVNQIDIYDPVAKADLESSLRNAPPLRIVFAAVGASQNYDVLDINGATVASGSIVPGQNNQLTLSVPASAGPPVIATAFQFTLSLSGRPAAGDNFTVGFNTNGVSDNRNALKLAALQTKSTVGVDPLNPTTTGASFTDAYGDLVERVGTLTSQARIDGEATGAILKQATDNRDSGAGVNLDEEAANLIQFQQYYQASAQIIKTAQALFDTLINTF
jgi:flagellar hook-associated protein 1 FlgK